MANEFTIEDLQQAISVLQRIRDANLTQFGSKEEESSIYDDSHLENLGVAFASFGHTHKFEIGQVVKWKPNMNNKKLPKQNQPAIVVEVLEKVLIDEETSASSTYFQEPLDIVLGVFGKDGTFLTFYHDSRRFEPYS